MGAKIAKALKKVGVVLGAVALVATGIGAVAGAAGFLGLAAGTWTTIGTIAGIAATAANIGSQALAKPPPARGSVAQSIFDPNAPQPYVMGEGYVGGVERYRVGYGGTVDKVSNPYLGIVQVYSGGGPVESITPYVDFGAVGSYYTGYLYTDTQTGATPEASALSPHFAGMMSWGSAYKLSGQAAILWNALFDKKGKKFSSGLPVLGAYLQGVKVYDPRLDSTFPGGSGSCRLGDESTYVYSDNPALHAGTYAYGRYQNSKRVFGIGLPVEGIDFATIAAWANVCDTNGWTIFGRIFEPGDRWQNLTDICMAGGAQPVFAGAVLSFRYSAPVVALDTITEEDNAGNDDSVTAMQSYRDRLNTIIPKYTSSAHNWEQVPAAKVQVSTYLTEDGEERVEEWPFNLVKDVDQATQLARYRLEDSRELHPIILHCKPRLRGYRPGDCLTIDRPDLGLDTDAIIISRSINPADMTVTLTLIGETPGKHAFALGMTGTPPETPALLQSGEDADTVSDSVYNGGARLLVSRSVNYPLSSDDDSIDVAAFTGVGQDGLTISFPAASPAAGSLTAGTTYHVFWDLEAEDYVVAAAPAATEWTNSGYIFIGAQSTSDGGVYPTEDPPPSGYCVADDTPILLAGGGTIPASQIEIGTVVRTRHERTMAWGDYPVAAISFATEPVFACSVDGASIRATADHLFWLGNRWVRAETIGTPDGTARVAKITVTEAHTYVSAGVLSHNIKAGGPGGI